MDSLQGLAFFIVLCAHFTLYSSSIVELVIFLLNGKLGGVKTDPKNEPQLPYNLRPTVVTFVESCIDSDRESKQAGTAKMWIAELASFGDPGWDDDTSLPKVHKAIFSFALELLGGPSTEQEIRRNYEGLDVSEMESARQLRTSP